MSSNPVRPIDDPLDPDEVQARIGRLIRNIYRHWRRKVDEEFKELNLTDATWAPLTVLYENQGAMHQKDLAKVLALEPSALVRVVEVLRQRGLLEWEIDPNDRRAKSISLTVEGRSLAAILIKRSQEIEKSIFEGIAMSDLEATRKTLKEMARWFEES